VKSRADHPAPERFVDARRLDRLTRASIPVDITFNQGKAVLGLE